MNTKHVLRAVTLLIAAFTTNFLFASLGGGSVMGQVTDPATKKPVDGATVNLECKGNVQTFFTDEKGFYYASNVAPGIYTITVGQMTKTTRIENVTILNDDQQVINVSLAISEGIELGTVTVERKATRPLIDVTNPGKGTITPLEVKLQGGVKLEDAVLAQPGVVEMDGNYYVRGSRDGDLAFYIDGCKVTGNPNIPINGVAMIHTFLNFIPAKYGDTLGGVMAIESRSWFAE